VLYKDGGNGVGGAIAVGTYSLLFSGYLDPSALTLTGSDLRHNTARGGEGGNGANGGDGLGGGLAVQVGASATVTGSDVRHNRAVGGEEGKGGVDGQGNGGGIYNGGTLTVSNSSTITGNTAPVGFGADVFNGGVLHQDLSSFIGILNGNLPT